MLKNTVLDICLEKSNLLLYQPNIFFVNDFAFQQRHHDIALFLDITGNNPNLSMKAIRYRAHKLKLFAIEV